jgi:hypothetical protein
VTSSAKATKSLNIAVWDDIVKSVILVKASNIVQELVEKEENNKVE